MSIEPKPKVPHTLGRVRFRMMGSEGGRLSPDTGNPREDVKLIAMVNGRDFHTDAANGEFIARAWNCHDELVAVLEHYQSAMPDFEVQCLLAIAKGQEHPDICKICGGSKTHSPDSAISCTVRSHRGGAIDE